VEVSKHFGGISALSQVTFEVAPGEVLGFIGPNGAGKTTLFDVISGFLPRDSGSSSSRAPTSAASGPTPGPATGSGGRSRTGACSVR
jgi:ABC-type branched-subunit amino acid transport system ATPase component